MADDAGRSSSDGMGGEAEEEHMAGLITQRQEDERDAVILFHEQTKAIGVALGFICLHAVEDGTIEAQTERLKKAIAVYREDQIEVGIRAFNIGLKLQ